MDGQFDVSPKLIRLFKEKEKIRTAIRQKVIAQENSPYRNPATLMDPAVIRYHAMLTYRPEYMYPTTRNMFPFLAFIVFPIIATYGIFTYTYHKREELYRSGKVPYKKRFFYQVL